MKLNVCFIAALSASCIGLEAEAQESSNATIADRISSEPDLTTLLAATMNAGIAQDLELPGFDQTIFAPTNKAFENLLMTSADLALLAKFTASPDVWGRFHLRNIINAHIIPGIVLSSDLSDGLVIPAKELVRDSVTVSVEAGTTGISTGRTTDAKLVATDARATNGVYHKIDKVLLQEWTGKNLFQKMLGDDRFGMLVKTLTRAGVSITGDDSTYTLLAPSDDAFASFLTGNETSSELKRIMERHVVEGIPDGMITETLTTVGGSNVTLTPDNGRIVVSLSREESVRSLGDFELASNGLLLPVDSILQVDEDEDDDTTSDGDSGSSDTSAATSLIPQAAVVAAFAVWIQAGALP